MDKARFGLIGGGFGAFIGQVHRLAAEMDGGAALVCGAFASDPERSRQAGHEIYRLPASRCYGTWQEMLAGEAALPETQRMQFVIIATPNHTHFDMALAALDAGFHVVCDKPLCVSVEQALELQAKQRATGSAFMVTYNYTGYPMVREARALVADGVLGEIRRVNCTYLQGWLAADATGNKQADWRTDPERAGAAGCFGDIGSHAENLLSYVSGLEIAALCADLSTFVPGRKLDDDGNVLLRFGNGARGVLSASQIAVGRENDLSLEICGERGSLEWQQGDANSLIVRTADAPWSVRRAGGPGIGASAAAASRVPAGHPEGYLEAFAELYRCFVAHLQGAPQQDYPGIEDGLRGVRFIEQVVASSAANAKWLGLDGSGQA